MREINFANSSVKIYETNDHKMDVARENSKVERGLK